MRDSDIHTVMKLLEKELETFGLPPVSAMAEEDVVDPFRILVSTIISARTKDEVTGPAKSKKPSTLPVSTARRRRPSGRRRASSSTGSAPACPTRSRNC